MLLIVLGTGTLGANPAVHARGHVVDPAAVVAPPRGEATDFGPGVLADIAAAPPTTLIADRGIYEEREAQFTTALPDQRAQVAIRTAIAQIGLPYVWGGDGPTNGDAGFDCSGLTTFSYAAAGVSLPRTAHTQYYKGPHVPQGAALQAGDLVFYGTPAKVHHVGMYLGGGKMVNAPTFGKPVQTAFYRYGGDDYLGATRPAANGETTSGLLPYAPPAPSTGRSKTFPAPVAPAPTTVSDVTALQIQSAETVTAVEATPAGVTATVTAAPTTSVVPTTSTTPPPSSPVVVTTAATSLPSTRPAATRPRTAHKPPITVTVTFTPSSTATSTAPSASATKSSTSNAPSDAVMTNTSLTTSPPIPTG
uniref:C40 family peptidase n=1 Tax=Pseudonocardia charpentierae TaxID=3075545 RepID=UPI0037C55BF8